MVSRIVLAIFLLISVLGMSSMNSAFAQTLWESRATISDLYGMTARQWAASERIVRTGDFNGNGRTDVLLQGVAKHGTGTCEDIPLSKLIEQLGGNTGSVSFSINLCIGTEGERNTLLLYGEPDGSFTERWLVSWNFGMTLEDWTATDSVIHIADFNNNGRDDLLLQGRKFGDPTLILYGLPGHQGFTSAQDITWANGMSPFYWAHENRILHVGDFDGDGNVDLLLQGKGTGSATLILYGTGYGGFFWKQDITNAFGMNASQWAASVVSEID